MPVERLEDLVLRQLVDADDPARLVRVVGAAAARAMVRELPLLTVTVHLRRSDSRRVYYSGVFEARGRSRPPHMLVLERVHGPRKPHKAALPVDVHDLSLDVVVQLECLGDRPVRLVADADFHDDLGGWVATFDDGGCDLFCQLELVVAEAPPGAARLDVALQFQLGREDTNTRHDAVAPAQWANAALCMPIFSSLHD